MRKLILAALLATASMAQASTPVFTDNFNGDTLGLNTTTFAGGWTVSSGTVDTIGTGFFDLFPGNGHYIDLDGSTSQAGIFSKTLSLTNGVTYTATFDLGGNKRGYANDTVDVSFGTANGSYTLASADPFGNHGLTFTAGASGLYTLSFHNHGGDNVGAVLDNVNVTAVPEPATYGMLLAGLAFVGFVARRRQG